jgi:hypothetical protein
MIESTRLAEISERLASLVEGSDPSARNYLQNLNVSDARLAARVLTAVRKDRRLQISISEEIPSADAFFKSTGLNNEERLLQAIYPVNSFQYDEAIKLLHDWIVELKPEKSLVKTFKSLF